MASSLRGSRVFRFGLFEADVANARLTRKGIRVRLQEQPFRILVLLLENSGQIVTREDLRRELWPSGTFVDFDGSLNAALKRLRAALDDNAENPTFIETVPKHGYRFIAPVTEAHEHDGDEVTLSLYPPAPVVQVPPEENRVPAPFPKRNRWIRPLSAAVFLAAIAAIAVFFAHQKRIASTSLVAAASARRSVAVLGFHNASGRSADAWLSTALPEMLRTELSAGGKLRVIPGEDVAQLRATSPWPQTDSLNPETSSQVGKALNGDLLVLGSYTALGEPQNGSIRIDYRLQQADSGEVLSQGAETGSVKDFFDVVTRIGMALRQRLGLPLVTASEESGVLSSLPANREADRFYALGVEKMRENDVLAAKDLFLQAESIAPNFPLVHFMLSRAWGGLGYDGKSRAESKRAFDLAHDLPQTDRLLIEGSYYASLKDLDRSASTYRALYALAPDSVDYAEQLISVLIAANHREEALGIVRQLRQLPAPTSDDPRIDFWESNLLSYGNGTAAVPFIDRAVAKAAASGQKILYARFRLSQCQGLIYSDHPQQANDACEEAYRILLAAGNRLLAADALRVLGDRRGSEGNFDGAIELYQRAAAMLAPLGNCEKSATVFNNMAIAFENEGQMDRSERLFHQAQQDFERCGDKRNVAVALSNVGDIFSSRGDLHSAEKEYQKSLDLMQPIDPSEIAYAVESIAEVRLAEGDLATAKLQANQAMTASNLRASPQDTSGAIVVLGDIALAGGDLDSARKQYQSALEIREPLGDKNIIAESRAQLAQILLEEGKAAEAESALRQSLAEFQQEKVTMDEIRAETDLARSLRMQGKLNDARASISRALSLSRNSRDPGLKLPATIENARVEAALALNDGKGVARSLSEPRQELQTASATARRLGYYQLECEARLALLEIDLGVHPDSVRRQAAELADETHRRGFELLSRRAAAIQKSSKS